MEIQPLIEDIEFGARITGVNLSALDNGTFVRIEEAVNAYAVLVIPGQQFDDETQIAFSRRFGPLEKALSSDSTEMGFAPEISHLGNIDQHGKKIPADSWKVVYDRGNQSWHTDSSFKEIPAKFSILSARIVPSQGGATEFADARSAYDRWEGMPEGTKKEDLQDLVCGHSIVYSRERNTGDIFDDEQKGKMKPSRQRLVRRHPATGRLNFYVGSHASHIEGWPEKKGRAVIDDINAWCVRPERVVTHEWVADDIVIWDNRRVLHRGRPWPEGDEVRLMHRTTVAGDHSSLDETF